MKIRWELTEKVGVDLLGRGSYPPGNYGLETGIFSRMFVYDLFNF